MSEPKEAAEALELRSRPKPVRRLSRKVLASGAGILGGSLLLITVWSLQPKAPVSREDRGATPVRSVDRVPQVEGLESLPRDYASVPRLGPPLGELGGAILRKEQAAGIDPLESIEGFALDSEDEAQRAQRLRDVQEDDAAAKAQVFFPLATGNRERPGRPADEVPASALERALTLLPQAAIGSASAPTFEQGSADSNGQATKRMFAGGSSDDEIYARGELETPRSPYQVMAGTVIPAALITGINSDLPGQIIATVTENVYDSVSGNYLLVPQGSRLIGRYDSDVAFGQRRVLLVWTRLLRPDGSSMVLDRLPGVDLAGYAGLTDRVDSKWSRVFAGAAASTIIGVGAELASPSRQEDGSRVVLAASDSLQGSITDVGQQVTQRNLDVQPTLTVRAGFPFRVVINKDIVLAPMDNESRSRSTR